MYEYSCRIVRVVDGDTVEGEPDSLSLSVQENEMVFSDNLDDPHNLSEPIILGDIDDCSRLH